jgi:hypothetical protein
VRATADDATEALGTGIEEDFVAGASGPTAVGSEGRVPAAAALVVAATAGRRGAMPPKVHVLFATTARREIRGATPWKDHARSATIDRRAIRAR